MVVCNLELIYEFEISESFEYNLTVFNKTGGYKNELIESIYGTTYS